MTLWLVQASGKGLFKGKKKLCREKQSHSGALS